MLTLLVEILIAIVIAGALYAIIGVAPVDEPFKKMGRIVILAFFVIALLMLLLDVMGVVHVGVGPVFGR